MICYYFFFNHGFKFQASVCNGCHDLTILSYISNIAIIIVKIVDYCCIIHNISKSKAISLLKNSVLEDRGCVYKNIFTNFSLFKTICFTFFVLLHIKWLIVSTSISQ